MMRSIVFVWILTAATAFGQECNCGGMIDDGQIEMASSKLVTFYIAPGSMFGISQNETHRMIRVGFREMAATCGVTFKEVFKPGGARIRIEFRGNDSVMYSGRDKDGNKLYALGKAWTSGRIAFNRDRKLKNYGLNRYIERGVYHEVGHALLRWQHVKSNSCIMHPWASSQYFCPDEVRRLQQRFGPPRGKFYPMDRVAIGRRIREDQAALAKAIENRQDQLRRRAAIQKAGNWRPDHPLQKQILQLNSNIQDRQELLRKRNLNWHKSNRAWKSSKLTGVA